MAVNWCIEQLQPRFFTLENVPSYLNSEAFIGIQNGLIETGDWINGVASLRDDLESRRKIGIAE